MGNAPVIHEVVTSCHSLGDAIAGDNESARKRWDTYASESVLGSGVKAAWLAAEGDLEGANNYAKGMGRATGQMIAGGGVLKEVPVFQELATAGKSLGDVIAGDVPTAEQRWTREYVENSCIGSGVQAAIEDGCKSGKGDHYRKQCGKAWASAGVTVAATIPMALAPVAAAPLGMARAVAVGASVGAATSVGQVYAHEAIHNNGDISHLQPGDVVGAGISGALAGSASGACASMMWEDANATNVYRVMGAEEGVEALKTNQLPHGHNQAGALGETWVSQSAEHAEKFHMQKLRQSIPEFQPEMYKITMAKDVLEHIKTGSIEQAGSRQVNMALMRDHKLPMNLLNMEKLPMLSGYQNIGIKTANLRVFNAGVCKIVQMSNGYGNLPYMAGIGLLLAQDTANRPDTDTMPKTILALSGKSSNRCYLPDALFQISPTKYTKAQWLQTGDVVQSAEGRELYIAYSRVYTNQKCVLVTLRTDQSELTVTDDHRIPTEAGEKIAGALQKGDQVYCGERVRKLTKVTKHATIHDLVELRFHPDDAVESLSLPRWGIHSKGMQFPLTTRNTFLDIPASSSSLKRSSSAPVFACTRD